MDIIGLKKLFLWRIGRIYGILRKLCNTIYYLILRKKTILVVNAPLFQFLNGIRHFNLGDDLNYYLLKELSGNRIFAYNEFYHFRKTVDNVMAIGSVIDWLGNDQSIVWGSGILIPPSVRTQIAHHYTIKEVVAVRGVKTREVLIQSGVSCPAVYGDPALLLPLIYKPEVKKVKGRIGFIPHYKDINNDNINRLVQEYNGNAILIKVQKYNTWQEVINQMLSCEFILSSSLHGLILADAYGVPNQWITFEEGLPGGTFKFEDYYSAVGKKAYSFMVNGATSIVELLKMKQMYQTIEFDPIPLLKACPFQIQNQTVLDLLAKG